MLICAALLLAAPTAAASVAPWQELLTDDLSGADEAVRAEHDVRTLIAACLVEDAVGPSYKLSYLSNARSDTASAPAKAFCVWRPWRVGSFIVDAASEERCECSRSE